MWVWLPQQQKSSPQHKFPALFKSNVCFVTTHIRMLLDIIHSLQQQFLVYSVTMERVEI